MSIKKMIDKLDEYFDMSKKKQKKKSEKIVKIISKLKDKESELKAELVEQSEKDDTSEKYYDLEKELKIITKLLIKAKKNRTLNDNS
ncbi:MAG: hypothetical protein HOM14_14050 [Gammaproteobacteria bacterium]|nr:hypothetical protein [Gammaproteobacteria bacterium]MBT3721818.1 hypothetical protein [Gammaproteobacteria bacterium]MBT4078341.1 hypothetical protein [Gammaproteobacteria bacterium]MBT4196098.1 hypothetical protein [Gammaproteobacteria bacterium]MBT4451786.1 hypothetical protein [Gammaproteobacteria bacterium]